MSKLTPAQQRALAQGRRQGAPAGGRAVATCTPPTVCPRCGRSYHDKSWYAWLGHKGLHTLADRYICPNQVKEQPACLIPDRGPNTNHASLTRIAI